MNIYIGGLDWDIQEGQLRKLFEEYGVVARATVIQDSVTHKSRGFGFVEMLNDEEAMKAIITLNGTEIEGRKLVVSKARPRADEPRGDRYPRDRYPER